MRREYIHKLLSSKALEALVLLLIFVSAYSIKALHTHPDSYYEGMTESSDSNDESALFDNCPICNFSFFPYLIAQADIAINPDCTTLELHPEVEYDTDSSFIIHHYLRAPPYEVL